MTWGHLCCGCQHLMSEHRLAASGDLRDGPYLCLHCECAIPQNGPSTPISEAAYRDFQERSRNKP